MLTRVPSVAVGSLMSTGISVSAGTGAPAPRRRAAGSKMFRFETPAACSKEIRATSAPVRMGQLVRVPPDTPMSVWPGIVGDSPPPIVVGISLPVCVTARVPSAPSEQLVEADAPDGSTAPTDAARSARAQPPVRRGEDTQATLRRIPR